MISNTELIQRTIQFLDQEEDTPTSNLISSIVNNITKWGQMTRKQHTYLVAFCISCEIAEAQYKGELPPWL